MFLNYTAVIVVYQRQEVPWRSALVDIRNVFRDGKKPEVLLLDQLLKIRNLTVNCSVVKGGQFICFPIKAKYVGGERATTL